METRTDWCPSDKRVRCINCCYLRDMGDHTHQCGNENGPVAMWHFLDDNEPKETWCEAFKPNNWLANQGLLPLGAASGEWTARDWRNRLLFIFTDNSAESHAMSDDALCAELCRVCDLRDAAPELLAALKALLSIDAVRFLWDEGPDGEGWQSDELLKALGRCDAAIAKAEGR